MEPFFQSAYDALFAHWGSQHWWPAQTRQEMMIGAILTQNTAWTNVENALFILRKNDVLGFGMLEEISEEQLSEWIHSAGYFNQKAGYLKGMAKTLRERFGGSLDRLFVLDTPTLRKELLSWKGIGPETADSILLYAAMRPVFVVDAYTQRILVRHRQCDENATYDSVAKLFTQNLPMNIQLFNEYHALIVQLGKTHCKSRSQCNGCPLEHLLPK